MKQVQLALICMTAMACAESSDADQATDPSTVAPTLPVFESNTSLSVNVLSGASCQGNQRLDPAFEVYDREAAFASAFKAIRPDLSIPSVDFGRFVVVGAFLGQRTGCGTQVNVASATNHDDHVAVRVSTVHAGAGCALDGSRSSPYVFAQLDRTDKPYVHVESVEEAPCP